MTLAILFARRQAYRATRRALVDGVGTSERGMWINFTKMLRPWADAAGIELVAGGDDQRRVYEVERTPRGYELRAEPVEGPLPAAWAPPGSAYVVGVGVVRS